MTVLVSSHNLERGACLGGEERVKTGFMSFSHTVYLKNTQALDEYHAGLKLHPCPHCHQLGFLIFNGSLGGYRSSGHEQGKRGQRVYCSNRYRKRGCGQTFSLLFAAFIKGWLIQAAVIATFISKVVSGDCRKAAWESLSHRFTLESGYRIWNRWQKAQAHLRSWLSRKCPPPQGGNNPLDETWLHLLAIFPESPSPIADFQHLFQTGFFPH